MKITLLPGDGIGPEIVEATVKVMNAAAKKFGFTLEYDHQLLGGCAIDAYNDPYPEAAVLNGTTWILPSVRKKACCASVRIWACTATCVL